MLLAAGRGERMRPLTDSCPKPLLTAHGEPLMHWPLRALAEGACSRAVINTAWLGEQISAYFGERFSRPAPRPETMSEPFTLNYSHEGRDFGGALETAGGIARALPRLCTNADPAGIFWVVAGDVFAPDFLFGQADVARFAASERLAHLWLVANPDHNPRGDFGLAPDGSALNLSAGDLAPRWTYGAIGLYRRALFEPPWCNIAPGNPEGIKAALAPLLRSAMDQGRVSAEIYTGRWTDVGTPERLHALNSVTVDHLRPPN
jgi:MurNAc alpha-1-phosphate uridylyltransferase